MGRKATGLSLEIRYESGVARKKPDPFSMVEAGFLIQEFGINGSISKKKRVWKE
jgi:hypothetical protein